MTTYNLSALFQVSINSTLQQIADSIATDSWNLPSGNVLPFRVSLANGAGDSQASNVWHDHRTLLTANNDDIYLNGNASFTNKFGVPLNLTNVKIIFLRMTSDAPGLNLTLGNHPGAPWGWEFGAPANTRDFRDFILEGSKHDGWTVGGVVAPAVAPTVAASGSGATIPTGTYFVKVTYNNPAGESLPSPANVGTAITLGQNLVITSPAAAGNATTYNVYVAPASGGPFVIQGAATALASNKTLTSFTGSGATPPIVSTAYQNSILRINNASGTTMTYDIALWGSP